MFDRSGSETHMNGTLISLRKEEEACDEALPVQCGKQGWHWLDGTPYDLAFDNWADNQPNSKILPYCTVIVTSGWNGVPCETTQSRCLCQKGNNAQQIQISQ